MPEVVTTIKCNPNEYRLLYDALDARIEAAIAASTAYEATPRERQEARALIVELRRLQEKL